MTDQTRPDRETQRNSTTEQSSILTISFGTLLIITLITPGGLLLIIILFYRQQKVSDRQCILALFKRPT